ncbi:MAG: hypothetical protein KH333_06425 [Clostridium sp.]|nr:hypothetical protein [Clostridium sp.]
MKWVMMILFNLIMYPSFKAIWNEVDKAKKEQKIKQQLKEHKCRGLMRECIMIYFTEEEMKMIELISWKKGYSDLKDKQVLRKIVIENIN